MNILKKVISPVKEKVFHTKLAKEPWLTRRAIKLDDGTNKNYLENDYDTNIELKYDSLAILTQKKERVIEAQLDEKAYSFDDTLVIINPYRVAPLSALLIFNTPEKCKVQYTILGKRGASDYTNCDESLTTRHRVAILGLYEGALNSVKVQLLRSDNTIIAQKNIIIRTKPLIEPIHNCVQLTKSTKPISADFYFVSGGYHGGVYAFDEKGNIRFALNKIPQYCGVYLFEDGKFLFPEKYMRKPAYGNAHSVVTYEMDMLGRVFRTYYQKKGTHHWGIEKTPGGNILSLSSSMTDTYMENSIIEMDRKTGKTIYELNLNDLFDDTYKTRNDWAHINSIDYIEKENCVIISCRNIHTVAKIDLTKREIVWILCNPEFYKNTNVEDKVLKPVGDMKWFFQQHGIQIIHDEDKSKEGLLHVMLFDNHTANRRPVDWFDNKEQSNAIFYYIDEKARTVSLDRVFEVPLSATRSNADYNIDKNIVSVMCANLKPAINDFKGKFFEFDYNTGECVNEFSCKDDYFAAHAINFNVPAMSTPIPPEYNVIAGNLCEPVKLSELPDDFKSAKNISEIDADNIRPRMFEDVLQINATDHDLEQIYLYNDKNIFMQDFTDTTQPLSVFKTQEYYVNMPLNTLPAGKYKLAIKHLDKIYTTEYYINIKKYK